MDYQSIVGGVAGGAGGGLARGITSSWTGVIIVFVIVLLGYIYYFMPTWSLIDVSDGHFNQYVGTWYKYDDDELKQLEILGDRSIIMDDRIVEMDNVRGTIRGRRITFCGEIVPDLLDRVTIDLDDEGTMRNISLTGLGTYYADKRRAKATK